MNKITFVPGEIAMCYYPKIRGEHELELYWCTVEKVGVEYASCTMYFGEEFDPTYRKGTFHDVCVADIVKVSDKDLQNSIAVVAKRKAEQKAAIKYCKTLKFKLFPTSFKYGKTGRL